MSARCGSCPSKKVSRASQLTLLPTLFKLKLEKALPIQSWRRHVIRDKQLTRNDIWAEMRFIDSVIVQFEAVRQDGKKEEFPANRKGHLSTLIRAGPGSPPASGTFFRSFQEVPGSRAGQMKTMPSWGQILRETEDCASLHVRRRPVEGQIRGPHCGRMAMLGMLSLMEGRQERKKVNKGMNVIMRQRVIEGRSVA